MTVHDRVRAFFRDNFYVDGDIAGDASLLAEGVIDSTGVLELIAFLEESFGITIEDHEMVPENLDSVDAIAAFVGKKRRAADPVSEPRGDAGAGA